MTLDRWIQFTLILAWLCTGVARAADVHGMVVKGDVAALKQALATDPSALKWRGPAGDSLLHVAAYYGRLDMMRYLLARGIDANTRSTRTGSTPLASAARAGQTKAAALLISGGAKVDAASRQAYTPLHNAAMAGHTEVAELLLGKGAHVNASTSAGETPLHVAATAGQSAMVQLLLKHHANVNARRKDKKTPLDLATEPAVRKLLEKAGGIEAP